MKITTKINLAAAVGVSRQAIGKLCKPGGPLHGALNDAGKIIIDHPDCLEYLKKKKLGPEARAALGLTVGELGGEVAKPKAEPKTKPAKKKKTTAKKRSTKAKTKTSPISGQSIPPDDIPDDDDDGGIWISAKEIGEDVETYLDLTLREITEKFGTHEQFKTLLDARKRIEEIKGAEFGNKVKQGEYIPRDMISGFVFPFIDNSFKRLVEDLPGTMARQIKSKVLAETDDEEIVGFIRDSIGKTIKGLKENANRMLNQ